MAKTISVSTPKAEAWRERMGLEPVKATPDKRKRNRERIRTVGSGKETIPVEPAPGVESLEKEVQRLRAELAKQIEKRKEAEPTGPEPTQQDDYRRKYQQSQNQLKQTRLNYEREKKARLDLQERVKRASDLFSQLAQTLEQLRQALTV
jgi:hypothetical protein